MKKRDSLKQGDNRISYDEALKRAAALCSRQEQCTRQILEKLRLWDMDDQEAQKIITNLQKEKFLDDGRYANFYVKDKFRFNTWGKIKILHMLRQKGIEEEVIIQALDQISDAEYFEACSDLIRKKSAAIKDTNQFTRKGKLFRYAAGRGFESDLIHQILNRNEY